MTKIDLIKKLAFSSTFLEVHFLLRKKKWKKINDALLKWFTFMRANNIPINGPILLGKALEFAKAFNYGDLKASNGWL